MTHHSRPLLVLVLAAVAGFAPACSWYFGPDTEEDDGPGDTTTVDTTTTGDPGDTTGDPSTDGSTTTGDDPGDCLTVNRFLARFGACLSLDEWDAAGLCEVPETPAGAAGDCTDCHSNGEERVFLSADCEETFEAQRSLPFVLTIVEPFSDRDGCYIGFRAGGGTLLMPDFAGEHPAFELPEATRRALTDLVNDTVARALDNSTDC